MYRRASVPETTSRGIAKRQKYRGIQLNTVEIQRDRDRERDRERDRDRERERQTEKERQTERERERQMG